MREIKLTQDKTAIVDDEDYDRLIGMKWHAWYNKNNKEFYAHHSVYIKGKSPTVIRMHRFILGVVDTKIHIDHINGDTLDNRKQNLRMATRKENARNRNFAHKKNKSGYRGVSYYTYERDKPWVAQIGINGKRKNLGYFSTAEEAAKAFDKAAREIYGEFCGKLNFE